MQKRPKCEELCDVLRGDVGGRFDIKNPRVVFEGLSNLPILSRGLFVNERGVVVVIAGEVFRAALGWRATCRIDAG